MKKQIFLFIILIGFLTTSPSYAANISGYYNCGTVLQYDKEDNLFAKKHIVSWFKGFYSGINFMTTMESTTYTPDSDSIYYATIKYCKDNPLKNSYDASLDIYNTITGNYLDAF